LLKNHKDNQELRGIVDSLSRQLQSLEKKIDIRKVNF